MNRTLLAAATTAALAGVNYLAAKRSERTHSPLGDFIEVEGVRLHYLDKGVGNPVLLLHGNIVSAEDYRLSGVFDALAARHRVVAFDRPGYGHSARPRGGTWTAEMQAELIAQAMERLGVENATIVGHSWGTLVALALALNHPERVRGLVLISGYYFPSVRIDALLAAPGAVPGLGNLLQYTLSPPLGRLTLPGTIEAMFAPNEVPDEFARYFVSGFPVRPWQIRAEAEDGVTMVPGVKEMQSHYGELHMPVTLMAGCDDQIVSFHEARKMHVAVPQSILEIVSDCGHMVHHVVPENVVRHVRKIG